MPPRTSRTVVAAIASVLVLALVAAAIVVVPAELLFRYKTGKWYHDGRVEAAAGAATGDFRLYRAPFPLKKPPGRIRILAVGGSTTYGFGVQAEEAWPAQLQRRLEARAPSRYEVVNVAYLGGHLESFISDFRHVARRYVPRERWLEGDRPQPADLAAWGWRDLEPDIVILVPIVNDTAPDYTFLRGDGGIARGVRRMERALDDTPGVRSLAVSYYLKVALQKLPHRDPDFRPQDAEARIRLAYQRNLERFMALWPAGTRIVLLGFPWLFDAGDKERSLALAMDVWGVTDRGELRDELSYFPALEALEVQARDQAAKDLAARSIVRAEIAHGIKARPFPERLRLYLDPVHVTAEGHALYAREIDELLARTEPAPGAAAKAEAAR